LLIFSHHLNNITKLNLFLHHIIMLINHYMISFSIILHDKFNILCKSTSKLPFYDGEFLFIICILLFHSLFKNEIIIKALLSNNSWFILVFIIRRYFSSIAYNINMNIFKGRLTKDWLKWRINNVCRRVRFDWAGCENNW
jgi:hypothetical protein